MPLLSHPAFGPRAALAYITFGALLDIWVSVWYFVFVRGQENVSGVTYFWLLGLFLSGLTLLVIGLMLGRIGQSARRAELPPQEALAAEAAVQRHATVVPVGAQPTLTAAAPPVPASLSATQAPVAPVPAGYTPRVTIG